MSDHNIAAIQEADYDSVMIDIGAHRGTYTDHMAKRAKKVYAFEPDPDNAKELRVVMSNRLNVEVIEMAVSNHNGTSLLMIHQQNPGAHSIHEPLDGLIFGHTLENSVEVKTTTLDKWCKSNKIKQVDFIKIDVEAHEAEVLEGAKETLKKYHPIIVLDTHQIADLKKAEKILKRCGYDIEELEQDKAYTIKPLVV